jgi:hypothetical protein
MKKLMFLTAVFSSLIVYSQSDASATQAGFERVRMENNLGNPRPESPQYRQCPYPADYGYWQAFDGGWIYFTAAYGYVVVKNPIFSKWAELGWEKGSLGFPKKNAYYSSYSETTTQEFDMGKISYRGINGTPAVTYNTINYPCKGTYRLILCGFKAHKQTDDDPMEWDGKGDEIFFRFDITERNAFGTARKTQMNTPVFGDVNREPGSPGPIILAGSRSEKGGIRTGDMHPDNTPWQYNALKTHDVPLTVWQGRIDESHRMLFVPTVWEWDNSQSSYIQDNWQQVIAHTNDTRYPFFNIFVPDPNSISGSPYFFTGLSEDRLGGNFPLIGLNNYQHRYSEGGLLVTKIIKQYALKYFLIDHTGFFIHAPDGIGGAGISTPYLTPITEYINYHRNASGTVDFSIMYRNNMFFRDNGTYEIFLRLEKTGN